jgi:transcriptional regulator with XRE-family HTH domain
VKVRNQKYLEAFGQNLKQIIDSKKKTPETVAALGNIETKQVYRAINAEHSVSLSVIAAIAIGLDMHPKKLFDFEFDFEEL